MPLPVALADDCGQDAIEAPGARVWAIDGCEGSVFLGASASFPGGRAELKWERDAQAGYTSFSLVLPPRFVSWHDDEYGCAIEVGVIGARDLGCPAGAPPAPPSGVAWGHLLP